MSVVVPQMRGAALPAAADRAGRAMPEGGTPLPAGPFPPPAAGMPPPAGPQPLEGALEELDGTPIRPPAPMRRAPVLASLGGARSAAAIALARPGLWILALVAFLARGGLVLLLLPIVVLPTFIGLANFVGPASVTAAGPTPRLVGLITAGLAAAAVLAVAGTTVAALAEAALHRAMVARQGGGPSGGAGDPPGAPARRPHVRFGAAAARIAVVRIVLLLPVVLAVALALPPWVAVAYRELTLPGDVATPLVVRILAGAPAASGAVLGAWLIGELAGGFAARRVALLDTAAPRALAEGLLDIVRSPAGTVLTAGLALGGSAVLLAPAMVALGVTWDGVRGALGGSADPVRALGATLALVVAWLVALGLAAAAASWRAALVTAELLRRGPPDADGEGPHRHEDRAPAVR